MLLAAVLLAACNGSDDVSDLPDGSGSAKADEIRLNADVWHVMEGTRATTYSNATDLQTEAQFKCTAYLENSLTPYISTTTVDWIAGASRWGFNSGNDHYYWPASGNLDFFGYMPETPPTYITTGPTYTADHNVTFTCTSLPMTNAGQGSSLKEFMFGMALGQNYGNAAAGVPLTFQHPFARIKLQLAASHPDITINSITFRSIQNNGSFTYTYSTATSTWTPSEDPTDFEVTLTGAAATFDNNTTAKPIGPDFIMIPQNWAGVIVVNADCAFWGEKKNYPSLTTTIPTNWQPGYSYTYTFNISPDDLIVNIAKFTEQW